MHVVLVNPEYPSPSSWDHGGIATYTYIMANALAQLGHMVHVLVKNGTYADPLNDKIILTEFSPKKNSSLSRFVEPYRSPYVVFEEGYSRGCLDAVMRIHATDPVDVVEIPEYGGLAHAFTGTLPFATVIHFHTPTAIVDSLNKIPLSPHRKAWHAFEAAAVRNAVMLRSPSESMKAIASSMYNRAPDDIAIIRQPLDNSIFNQYSYIVKDTVKIHILFAGRFEYRKGADIVFASIKEILAIDKRIHISIAGETAIKDAFNYRDAIEKALTLEERFRVWFLGAVQRIDLFIMYKSSHLLLLPSLFDNAPFCLFEAMASGLPVVASDVGGINEVINHGKNGMLFSIERPSELISAIQKIVDNYSFGEELGKNARMTVEQHHSAQTIAQQSIELYTRALARIRTKKN